MRYWLPGLGVVVGLSLMAAAVFAQGQQGAAATETPAAAAPQPDGHGFQGRGGDGWRGHRHMFVLMRPEEFCRERYARRVGFLAYLEAKLDLTDTQKPLWIKYQQASLDVAQKQHQGCLQNAGTNWREMSVLDRRQRMEQFLKARLDGLQETDPPLQALYQALTPDQHKVLDNPRPRRGDDRR
jgi:LTXXQ motif family protein